jgi:hypothetical protein
MLEWPHSLLVLSFKLRAKVWERKLEDQKKKKWARQEGEMQTVHYRKLNLTEEFYIKKSTNVNLNSP